MNCKNLSTVYLPVDTEEYIPCIAATNKIRFVDHSNTLNATFDELFLPRCALSLLPLSIFTVLIPLEGTTFQKFPKCILPATT